MKLKKLGCKCGSKLLYVDCCARFIDDKRLPATPEELMRSRYTAYTQANIDYIAATMCERASIDFDIEDAYLWASSVKWLKLEVIKTYLISDLSGVVEFKAYFRENNKKHCLHEVSEFEVINNRWFYVGMLE